MHHVDRAEVIVVEGALDACKDSIGSLLHHLALLHTARQVGLYPRQPTLMCTACRNFQKDAHNACQTRTLDMQQSVVVESRRVKHA